MAKSRIPEVRFRNFDRFWGLAAAKRKKTTDEIFEKIGEIIETSFGYSERPKIQSLGALERKSAPGCSEKGSKLRLPLKPRWLCSGEHAEGGPLEGPSGAR